MIVSNSVRNFKFEKRAPGETVIKYGETGKTFFIILKGRLDIFIPKDYVEELKDQQTGEITKKKMIKEEKVSWTT